MTVRDKKSWEHRARLALALVADLLSEATDEQPTERRYPWSCDGCGAPTGSSARRWCSERCGVLSRRRARIQSGLCTNCRRPASAGRQTCEHHAAQLRDHQIRANARTNYGADAETVEVFVTLAAARRAVAKRNKQPRRQRT